MNQPDYRDFYPKSLIPIGSRDKIALFSLESLLDDSFQATHWLVALQGRVRYLSEEECCQWQVYLYPADLEGSYSWERPYYVSKTYESLDKALEISSELETFGRDDVVISSNLKEKIS